MQVISDKSLALILRFEGYDQPGEWPGGSSGVTIGIGYDLGYESNFVNDWQPFLPANDFQRLVQVLGLTGGRAHDAATHLRDIRIPRVAAEHVFKSRTLPKYEAQTASVFPDAQSFPPDAFGGLVSLVFNRGTRLTDIHPAREDRREMRAIRQICVSAATIPAKVSYIAQQVRSMARLWVDNLYSDGDLHDRRIAEANLIAQAS